MTFVSGVSRTVVAQPSDLDPRIETLVGAVSNDRLATILRKLESFGTRNTLSSTDSPTSGIGAARQWILDEMKAYSPKLQVSFDTYKMARQGRITRDVELRNVIAVLPGRSGRRVYVSGHYDTVAIEGGQSSNNAGAGTGVRIAQPADPEAPNNISARRERRRQRHCADDGGGAHFQPKRHRLRRHARVHVYVAEEQGLFGAFLHAQKAAAEHSHRRGVQQRHRRRAEAATASSTARRFVYARRVGRLSSRELARFVQR